MGWLVGGGTASEMIGGMSEEDMDGKFSEFLRSKEGEESFNNMSTEDQRDLHQTLA